VKECPDPNGDGTPYFVKSALQKSSEDDVRKKLICKYGVDPADKSISVDQLVKQRKCAGVIIPSKTSMHFINYSICIYYVQ